MALDIAFGIILVPVILAGGFLAIIVGLVILAAILFGVFYTVIHIAGVLVMGAKPFFLLLITKCISWLLINSVPILNPEIDYEGMHKLCDSFLILIGLFVFVKNADKFHKAFEKEKKTEIENQTTLEITKIA